MGSYIGKKPSDVPLTSGDITDNIITSSKIVDGTIVNADINDVAATKLSGSIADARVPASAVTQHVTATDLTPVRQDILTLGLKQAVQENSTKFNLPNSAITKFEADADFNLAGSTTVGRNASEYLETAALGNTDATDGSTTVTDASGTVTGSITATGSAAWQDTVGGTLGGSCGMYFGGDRSNSYFNIPNNNTFPFQIGSGNWTIEMFVYNVTAGTHDSLFGTNNAGASMFQIATNGTDNIRWWGSSDSSGWTLGNDNVIKNSIANGSWKHIAMSRVGADFRSWYDGTRITNTAIFNGASFVDDNADLRIGANANINVAYIGYIDQIRISDTVRYSGTTITVPSGTSGYTVDSNTKLQIGSRYSALTTNATGTALGTTNVPSSAVTDVSGVMLLKNAYGTNTLGTDVKIYFTADNSNWTEATSYADAGTFSTGIKMIKLGKTTCTSGSDVRWKAVWANQSASSKEAHIYGIGLNY